MLGLVLLVIGITRANTPTASACRQHDVNSIKGTLFCERCGKHILADSAFCPECGQPVLKQENNTLYCMHCGKDIPGESRFCLHCGGKL